jgi:hypothetical protein
MQVKVGVMGRLARRDRLGYSPRTLTAAIGLFFTLPGLLWFITRRWWDRDLPRG